MKVKTKVIASYMLITVLMIVIALGFMISAGRIKTFLNVDLSESVVRQDLLSTLNTRFLSSVVILKNIINENDIENVFNLQEDVNTANAELDQLMLELEDTIGTESAVTVVDARQQLLVLQQELFQLKTTYLETVELRFEKSEEIDSLYRQMKGLLFVLRNIMKQDPTKQDEAVFLEYLLEDILEIKIYSSSMISYTDDYDIEDSHDSIISYSNVLERKITALKNGSSYQGTNVDRIVAENQLTQLNRILERSQASRVVSEQLYAAHAQALDTQANLLSTIATIESTLNVITAELNAMFEASTADVKEKVTQINAIVNQALWLIIIMTLIALGLAGGIGWYSSERITRPLTDMMVIAESIKNGDLHIDDLESSSSDEFGMMNTSINEMKGSLKELVLNIKDMTNILADNSGTTSTLMQGMLASLQETAEQLDSAASSTEEMSASSIQISQSVNEGINEVSSAQQMIVKGNDKLQSAIHNITDISNNLTGVSGNLDELKVASEEIGNIINIIVDIAEQTNLLALNAAIEAARAGDAGRGFAVVADEVRKLAEKTGTSTKNISGMINTIQENIDQVVVTVDNGIKSVDEGSHTLVDVGSDFKGVVKQMDIATNAVQPIITTMDEQARAISSVSSTVNSIAEASQENRQVVEEVNEMASKLSELALQLQEFISHYRV